jgi:hypothetical protein
MQRYIEEINIEDVKINDKIKYNSNNHWIDNKRPVDYDIISELTETKHWINLLKKFYFVVIFESSDIKLLQSMHNTCLLKNSIPNIYEDEIEYLMNKYKFIDDYLKINGGHFVRFENVSLKFGKNGCCQYTNFKQILESILTTPKGHSPLDNTKEMNMYLLPWVKINKCMEFRVFVYNNQITAISQQHLYNSNNLLFGLDEKTMLINDWIDVITNYFKNNIKNKITYISNYIFDFAILDNETPYFIEINPFGKEYS